MLFMAIKSIVCGANTASSCHASDLCCLRAHSLEMKCLLLTVTLFGLWAILQAQDDLPVLSDEKKVRQVVVVV